jgi:HEAT repeat protein
VKNPAAHVEKFRFILFLSIAIILGCFARAVCANGWEHTSIDLEILLAALDDENSQIRQRAAESLGYRKQAGTSEALLARLEKNELEARVRQAIYGSLGKIGDPAALGAIKRCLDQEKDNAVRAQCAGTLGNFESPLAEQIALGHVDNEHHRVRLQSIASLGSFSSATVIKSLIELLEDEDGAIENAALLSLGRTGSMLAEPVLIEALQRSEDRDRVLIVLRALTFLASPGSADAIRNVKAICACRHCQYPGARIGIHFSACAIQRRC